jgi:hypothetical protein
VRFSRIALLLTLPALCPAELAPFFLDHVTLVVAKKSFDSLCQSLEIRALAPVLEKAVGTGPASGPALFLTGRQTVLELIAEGPGRCAGASGLGFVCPSSAGLDHLQDALRGRFGDRVRFPGAAGVAARTSRELSVSGRDDAMLLSWFTDYNPGFIALRGPGRSGMGPPGPLTYFASPYRPDQLFDDIVGLTLALDPSETTVLVDELHLAGWVSRPAGLNVVLLNGPDAVIRIVSARTEAGIREVRLRLRRAVKRRDVPIGAAELVLEGPAGRLNFGPTN